MRFLCFGIKKKTCNNNPLFENEAVDISREIRKNADMLLEMPQISRHIDNL